MSSLSLLREKFIIREVGLDSMPVIALGNRFVIPLPGIKSPLVIRGHSMHMTLRLGAEILKHLSYQTRIENVETLCDWDSVWDKVSSAYEKDAVPETWVVVYFKGKSIYQYNPHHMFFDVIEQCEYKNNMKDKRYEKSIIMAQNAFQNMGKNVLIEEESHIGFILDDANEGELRFAIILRMPGHKGTFITRIAADTTHYDIIPQNHGAIHIAADYIEAINMAVRAGFMERNAKTQRKAGPELTNIKKRLNSLALSISQAETKYKLNYRPERPDFQDIMKKCTEN